MHALYKIYITKWSIHAYNILTTIGHRLVINVKISILDNIYIKYYIASYPTSPQRPY